MALGDDTRRRILEAARTVFAERGLEGGTVRQIADLADVNLASINYHFRSKEGLYFEVLEYAFRSLINADRLENLFEVDLTPTQRVEEFVRSIILQLPAVEERSQFIKLISREYLSPTGAIGHLEGTAFAKHRETVENLVRPFYDEDANQDELIIATFWLIGQCIVFSRLRPVLEHVLKSPLDAPEVLDQVATQISDLATKGLSGQSSLFRGR